MQRSTLAAVQIGAAALVVLGTVSLAIGLYGLSSYDCESGYVYDVTWVPSGEVDGSAVPFENLDPPVREGFLQALDDVDDPDLVHETAPDVVRYRGEHYEVVTFVLDCDEPPGIIPTLVGAPLLAIGLFVLLPVSVVLRTRDWDG